ncbi:MULTISPECIES: PIG-L deacetylase family protein [Cupriavidus]|uniref:PIG-L deacetylase family protein n=1 Tax=Cupriavidus TaxID=106589 RepID=UPI000291587C|nr:MULTISPECIES: PIG-L family deacetylase [Cupriavidus]ESJ25234.1 GlcNAc-PI de-N-acetylase [Cupriavidus sp. HPC(L)]MCD9122689.1 PIG-L family deacetylase [Cupriavidus sp. UGS-1]
MSLSVSIPLVVISPHLDDAVFSCGNLLAACPGSVVVTVFAGVPPVDMPAPDWDRRAGFSSAAQAVLARREEDRAGLAILDAQPVWLDFLDSQYNRRHTAGEIAAQLSKVISLHNACAVVAPCGLYHSDHTLVHEACARLWRERDHGGPPWLYYEEAIYRRKPGMLHKLLARWHAAGTVSTPVDLAIGEHTATKARACNAYASQLAMFDSNTISDLSAPERYWQWEASAGDSTEAQTACTSEGSV